MRYSAETAPDIRVRDARIEVESLVVDLMDGRTISVPLAWYPRLSLEEALRMTVGWYQELLRGSPWIFRSPRC